jgi:hypothetical protein
MKIYSKSREDRSIVIVDWNIGNRCDLACGYCHPHFRSGTNPFPSLDQAKLFADKVIGDHRARTNRMVQFSFTGGEPTDWPDLPDLCAHLKAQGCAINVNSNGLAPIPVWDGLASAISTVSLTYHEKGSETVFVGTVQRLRSAGVGLSIRIAMTPGGFERLLVVSDRLEALGFSPSLECLYADHARRMKPLAYTMEQFARMFPPSVAADMVLSGGEGGLAATADAIIHHRQNSFTGMKCAIGIDQFVVDQDGTVYGGWCRVGGSLGNVHEGTFERPYEAFTCTKAVCSNPLDLSVRKWRD